jgi:hypothetical protein
VILKQFILQLVVVVLATGLHHLQAVDELLEVAVEGNFRQQGHILQHYLLEHFDLLV